MSKKTKEVEVSAKEAQTTDQDNAATALELFKGEDGGDIRSSFQELLDSSPYYNGLDVETIERTMVNLAEKCGEEVAHNWLTHLRNFSPEGGDFDLDAMSFGSADDPSELDRSGVSIADPAPSCTLAQKNTEDLPHYIQPGNFFSKLRGELLARTWDPSLGKGGSSVEQEGWVLVFHRSRSKFEENSKKAVCWSKDGIVNREGGLCSDCPFSRTTDCTTQMNVVFLTKDFKEMFKVSFSKTSYADGGKLTNRLKALRAAPFSVVSALSAKTMQNQRGTWFSPEISVRPAEKTSDEELKAVHLLASCYLGYFKEVKTRLEASHTRFKEKKEADQKSLTQPNSAGALPAGNPSTTEVGVGDNYFGGPSPNSPVDLNSLK